MSCIIDKRKLMRILFIFFIVFSALRPNLAAVVASTSTSAAQAVASFSVFNAATPTENVRPLAHSRCRFCCIACYVVCIFIV